MKISTFLPQFKGPTLLIVTGKQEACFYVAIMDEVSEIDSIKVKKTEYTDREGRFAKSAGGRIMQSGSMNELHADEEAVRTLAKWIAETAASLVQQHGVSSIYMFVPTYLAKRMEESLPADLQKMVEYIFYGNYHRQHPFVMLSKIREMWREEKIQAGLDHAKPEALDILKKTAPFPHGSN